MGGRPNIILCLCDQLRAFEVGCYGNKVIRTPALDRLAAEGVRFETAVTNYPVCMAARSVLLSGQYNRTCTGGVANVAYPGRPGEFHMPEYPDFGRPHLKDPTLPELLHAQGYETAAIGKWHIHSWPSDIGFDSYVIPRVHHCHSGQNFTENGGPEFSPAGWSLDFEAARVAQFLDAHRNSTRPFFLYYNLSPPHCPLADVPEEYRTLYAPPTIPIRPNVDLRTPLPNQERWFKIYRYDFRHYSLHLPYANQLPAGYDLRRLIAEYYGAATWMDATLGKMLAALDEAGLTDNTLLLFTSDHGDNLGSHGLVQKDSPNEEAIRIPLIVRWPARLGRARVVTGQVASLVDLTATVLDLAAIGVPGHVQGNSLAPILRGQKLELPQNRAFLEIHDGIGIRTPRYLYYLRWQKARRIPNETPTFFYDIHADPYQLRNLAATDGRGEAARALHAELLRWHDETPWMKAPDPAAN